LGIWVGVGMHLHLGHHVVHLGAGHAIDLDRKGFARSRLLRRHGGGSVGAFGDDATTVVIGRTTGRRRYNKKPTNSVPVFRFPPKKPKLAQRRKKSKGRRTPEQRRTNRATTEKNESQSSDATTAGCATCDAPCSRVAARARHPARRHRAHPLLSLDPCLSLSLARC